MSEKTTIVRFGCVKGEIDLEYSGGGRPPGMPWMETSQWIRLPESTEDPRATALEGKDGLWLLVSVSMPLAKDDENLRQWPLDENGDVDPNAPAYFDISIDDKLEQMDAKAYEAAEAKWTETFSEIAIAEREIEKAKNAEKQ